MPYGNVQKRKEKHIWRYEKEKKSMVTPNKSSWTILIAAFGQEKGDSLSNLNYHWGWLLLL